MLGARGGRMATLIVMITAVHIWSSAVFSDGCQQLTHNQLIAGGKYCPPDSTIVLLEGLLWRHCNAYCIQSPRCQAVNYNTVNQTCSMLTKPCFLADHNEAMIYVIFTDRKRDECYEWVIFRKGDEIHERAVKDHGSECVVAKADDAGADRIGYLYISTETYFASDGIMLDPKTDPFQILNVREGCTVMWLPFIAVEDPWPPGAIPAGLNSRGQHLFVAMKLGGDGSSFTFVPLVDGSAYANNQLELLLVL